MTSLDVLSTTTTRHYLSQLLDTGRGRATFRDALAHITTQLVTRALWLLGDPGDVTFVPIIRGGLGMVDGALAAAPHASVGHVGIYRDKTTRDVVEYYSRLPRPDGGPAIVLDPMVASGGTMHAAVDIVASAGFTSIAVATVVTAQAGLELLGGTDGLDHVVTCAIDDDEPTVGVLANGLGDAGARLYGTA